MLGRSRVGSTRHPGQPQVWWAMLRWMRHRTMGEVAMSGRKAVATTERWDTGPIGVARRKRFDDSLDLLRALGLSPAAVDRYRRLARKTHKLPHMLVCTQDGI